MGFKEGILEKPEKWEAPESDEEGFKIDKTNFNYKEFIADAIDDNGNIKNGGSLFGDYFFKKVSPVLGEEKTKYYIDISAYTDWKGGEMQNDLCEFINDDKINKKDIEKIVAVKLIHDMVYYLADYEGGVTEASPFVSNSLISRFKNNNVSILEKSFIKKNIYDICDLEKDNPDRYSISDRYEKEEKSFLEKEIGIYYLPKNSHDKKFDNFDFSFNKDQLKAIEYPLYDFDSNGEVKPVDYYENNNIERPTSYKIGENGIEGFINECYITSYVAPGIVGIYSNDGTLIGWKNVVDLKKDELNSVNDIFEIKKNNQISIEDLALFRVSSSLSFRNDIQEMLSIDLSQLSLDNQFYFLNFIQGKTENEIGSFKEFIKNSNSEIEKNNKIKTFLSIEHGGKEMGDKIITLGEKLPESSSSILFKTYGEMINASDGVGDILKDNLKDKATEDVINKAKESLLVNGKDLLEKYGDKAKGCEGQTCEDIGRELEERLSLAKKSVFAFSAACKVLVERGEFSFEYFQKAKLSYDESPIPEKMQEKIIKMHNENTKQYPDTLKYLWRGTLKDGLTKPNSKQLVVSASYEDEVVSAMRVIKREDGSWYGASFNVNPTIQGGRIGTELLKQVLKDLAKDKPFVADCYSKNPMLSIYLNKFGFKITKEIENYHDTGELVYEITIFPEDKKEI